MGIYLDVMMVGCSTTRCFYVVLLVVWQYSLPWSQAKLTDKPRYVVRAFGRIFLPFARDRKLAVKRREPKHQCWRGLL
jgi:hypothetical protein